MGLDRLLKSIFLVKWIQQIKLNSWSNPTFNLWICWVFCMVICPKSAPKLLNWKITSWRKQAQRTVVILSLMLLTQIKALLGNTTRIAFQSSSILWCPKIKSWLRGLCGLQLASLGFSMGTGEQFALIIWETIYIISWCKMRIFLKILKLPFPKVLKIVNVISCI